MRPTPFLHEMSHHQNLKGKPGRRGKLLHPFAPLAFLLPLAPLARLPSLALFLPGPPAPPPVNCRTNCLVSLNCFSSRLTSWTVVPLPRAIRLRRLEL